MAKRDAKDTAKFLKPPKKEETRRPSGRTPLTKGKDTASEKKGILGAMRRISDNPGNFRDRETGKLTSKGYDAVKKLADKRSKVK